MAEQRKARDGLHDQVMVSDKQKITWLGQYAVDLL
jgi:hypothetical protein